MDGKLETGGEIEVHLNISFGIRSIKASKPTFFTATSANIERSDTNTNKRIRKIPQPLPQLAAELPITQVKSLDQTAN